MSETFEQQLRAGRNQALFREVNERIGELQTAWLPLTEMEILCECFDETCSLRLAATREEYEAVRASPVRFLVHPTHVAAKSEIVVGRNDRFWIVEKIGRASDVARAADPRRA